MNLRTRTKWMLVFRLTFLSVMAGSALMIAAFYGDPISPFLILILSVGATSLVVSFPLFKLLKGRAFKWFSWAQIFWDIGFTTLMVSVMGAATSAYVLLYGVNILMASILYYSRGSIVAGLASALGYSMMVSALWGTKIFSDQWTLSRSIFTTSALLFFGAAVGYLFKNRENLAKNLAATTANYAELTELHTAIVKHIPSGILYLDPQGQVRLINDAAARILGRTWVGLKLEATELEPLLQVDGRFETEVRCVNERKAVGHHREVLPTGGSIIVFQDVTAFRELEEKGKLQQKLAAVGQLGAGIAHEIRNPLASLSGSVQMLRDEFKASPEATRLMTIVLRETTRLDLLAKNFLDYAKPSQLQLEKTDLSKTITEVVELLKNSDVLKTRQVEWRLNFPENFEVVADDQQMHQVIWNLLKNAAESIESSGYVAVAISRYEDGGFLLEISDSGSGIPEDAQKKIFDPFFTTKGAGTGLGLSLVYQMIASHQGEISVSSTANAGTTFRISIPNLNEAEGIQLRKLSSFEVRRTDRAWDQLVSYEPGRRSRGGLSS